jgi:hypothetical protein
LVHAEAELAISSSFVAIGEGLGNLLLPGVGGIAGLREQSSGLLPDQSSLMHQSSHSHPQNHQATTH